MKKSGLTFVKYLESKQIMFTQAIVSLIKKGNIVVDEDRCTITTSSVFKRRYPDLHEVTLMLSDMWAESEKYKKNIISDDVLLEDDHVFMIGDADVVDHRSLV